MKTNRNWTLIKKVIAALQITLLIGFVVYLVLHWTSPNPLDSLMAFVQFSALMGLSLISSYAKYRIEEH